MDDDGVTMVLGTMIGIGIVVSVFGIAHGCCMPRDCDLCDAHDIRGGSSVKLWVCPACRSKVYGIYDNKGNNKQGESQK